MKRKKIIMLVITVLLLTISFKVNAASTCSQERSMELSALANNVKADYVEYQVEYGSDYDPGLEDEENKTATRPAFYVRVYNIVNDLNVRISLDGAPKQIYANSKNLASDGILYINSSYPDKVKNYTITIRSNDSNCQNEVLRQITVTVPMQNYFYNFAQCEENPEYYLCQEYTTTDYTSMTDDEFVSQINKYVENKKEEEQKQSKVTYKILEFIKKYKWYFITLLVIAIGIVIFVIIRNKQRRKLV